MGIKNNILPINRYYITIVFNIIKLMHFQGQIILCNNNENIKVIIHCKLIDIF